MNDRNVMIAGSIIGALAGVAVGYLFFTEEGRRWREQARGKFLGTDSGGRAALVGGRPGTTECRRAPWHSQGRVASIGLT